MPRREDAPGRDSQAPPGTLGRSLAPDTCPYQHLKGDSCDLETILSLI